MIEVYRRVTIDAPAGAVWNTVGDFGAAAEYLPPVASCQVEGSGVGAVRTLELEEGGEIVERLEALDTSARVLRYSILHSPLPVDDYLSTLKVKELDEARCEVEWSSRFEANGVSEAEARAIFESLYEAGLEALKELHTD